MTENWSLKTVISGHLTLVSRSTGTNALDLAVLTSLEYSMPQLLVPLQHSPSFLLVYNEEYILGSDAMSGSLELSNPVLFLSPGIPENEKDPRFPATSSRLPVWTAWSRALRIAQWDESKQEVFHVVREDGQAYYFQMIDGVAHQSGKMANFEGYVDQG